MTEYLGDPGNCDRSVHVCHPYKRVCVARGADCVTAWADSEFAPKRPANWDGWRDDPSLPSTCMRTNEKRSWIVKTTPGPGGRKCKDRDGTWAHHPFPWPVLTNTA